MRLRFIQNLKQAEFSTCTNDTYKGQNETEHQEKLHTQKVEKRSKKHDTYN